MALNPLDLGTLGAVETQRHGHVRAVAAMGIRGDGNGVTVKIIHESDQFLQAFRRASSR